MWLTRIFNSCGLREDWTSVRILKFFDDYGNNKYDEGHWNVITKMQCRYVWYTLHEYLPRVPL